MKIPRYLLILGSLLLLNISLLYPQNSNFNKNIEISSADTVKGDLQIKNSRDEVIFKVTEVNDGMTIFLPPVSTLNDYTNRLYNLNNTLHWNNTPISTNGALNWNLNLNQLSLNENISYLGIGTVNPLHRLHIEGGNIFVKGSSDWFPGLIVRNDIGRSVLNLQGTVSSENFRSAEIILGNLSNNSSWSLLNTDTDRLIFVSQSPNSEYRSPLQIDFAAPTNSFTINSSGNIGLGVWSNEHKLAVAGSIISEEVVVKLKSDWPDFVFYENYNLRSLAEVEDHIKENSHLEGIPSSREIQRGGQNLAEIQSKLLLKIEELTLYLIDQDKEIEQLKKQIEFLMKVNK